MEREGTKRRRGRSWWLHRCSGWSTRCSWTWTSTHWRCQATVDVW